MVVISLQQLAEKLDAELFGDPKQLVDSCATLESAKHNQLSFIYNKGYTLALQKTCAGVVILSKEFQGYCPTNALVVANPYLAYAKAATLLNLPKAVNDGVHPSAILGDNVVLSDGCSIAPNVVIGDNVRFGKDTRIGPSSYIADNVVIGEGCEVASNVSILDGTKIGNHAIIYPGAVIGADGFGHVPKGLKKGWLKIPQLGRVIIGNHVEIGANTTIDCGALDNTIIGNGVKIDNLVQIAHNVTIGDHTAIAACTGIAGSSQIGKDCTLAGGVGLVGHLSIADGVHITAMTMVTHSIKEPGAYSSGTPFQENSDWLKNAVRFKQLDKLSKKINGLLRSQKTRGNDG